MLQLIYLPFSQSRIRRRGENFLGSSRSSTLELEKGALIGLRALHTGWAHARDKVAAVSSFGHPSLPYPLLMFYLRIIYHECWTSILAVN